MISRERGIIITLITALPIFLICCAPINDEQERKAKVQALIHTLATESVEKRKLAYADLQDIYVRKRDLSDLEKKISQNPDSEVAISLRKLITYIEARWRLPEKGWVDNILECVEPYLDKSELYGSSIVISDNLAPRNKPIILAEAWLPDNVENINNIVDLIKTLEPESLRLLGAWQDITFVSELSNLEELGLYDTNVVDLTSLKRLSKLRKIQLKNTKVKDLSILKEMPNLKLLYIESPNGLDLNSLKHTSISIIFTKRDM